MRDTQYDIPYFISYNIYMIFHETYEFLIVIYDLYRTLSVVYFKICEIFRLFRDIWHVLCQLILCPYRPANRANYFSLGVYKILEFKSNPRIHSACLRLMRRVLILIPRC